MSELQTRAGNYLLPTVIRQHPRPTPNTNSCRYYYYYYYYCYYYYTTYYYYDYYYYH